MKVDRDMCASVVIMNGCDKYFHDGEIKYGFCIRMLDPSVERESLKNPHHSTTDIEFWGPDGMRYKFLYRRFKSLAAMGEF